ncbi:uncharacterized protein LOC130735825 isoform X2 [Lotus japonicus]|uniref:uncharacterized protein LOC130735825 isoform X2 n=1 Tax=Lotus japonicus TaxID=34305 RepID=UPI0025880F37|nr:uncharacterized protein LOC130735825 isoform X2 [Lotus japonicus]
MSLRVDDVSSIDVSKETWSIVVKVIRLWLTPSYSGSKLSSSLEMVFMDPKGAKIHASIRRTLVYRFQNLLTEGRVYQISFFGVCENGGDFRTTPHPYKVNFQMHTTVRILTTTNITGNPFSFMPLCDVVFKEPDTSYLIDVIGILTGSSGEQEFEKHGRVQKRITLELDQEGVRIETAFFGKYVDEIVGQLASGDMTNAVVVIQFAKIKPFKGKASIQNVYGATRILFNPAVEEAAPLRARFFETNDPASQVLSQLQDSGKLSPAEDFLRQNEGRTIEQIKDSVEKSVCVVLATVKFIPDDNSWYYPACKCNKKVYPAEDMYFCESCVRHVVTAIPKYKIRLRVMDAKDSTTFVLFDQEAYNLMNKPCSELVEKSHKDPNDPQVPLEILSLIDKTFLFKIEVDNSSNTWFEPSYRVKRICADPDVISQFKILNPQIDGSPLYLMSTPSSSTMPEGSSSSFSKNLSEEFNGAGDPNVGNSLNSPVVDLSKDTQEGSIVLASVAELKMQFSSNRKSHVWKPEIKYKDKVLNGANVSKSVGAGSFDTKLPSVVKEEPAPVSVKVEPVSSVAQETTPQDVRKVKEDQVEQTIEAVVTNNESVQVDIVSSISKNAELTDVSEVDVNLKQKTGAGMKVNSVANLKETSPPDENNVKVCDVVDKIEAALPDNVLSKVPLQAGNNDSPPSKRPVPVDVDALANGVGTKKSLKIVKQEKM